MQFLIVPKNVENTKGSVPTGTGSSGQTVEIGDTKKFRPYGDG